MKGLDICEGYFKNHENELIEAIGEDDYKRITVGLVGQGSECFGFDDDFSTDHDFGPGFCIFTDEAVYNEIGDKLERFYSSLPGEFNGMKRNVSEHGQGRVGVIKTEEFYYGALGVDVGPLSLLQWYSLSEDRLAMALNGRIFHEGDDEFMQMRKNMEFFPDDVFLKKLSSRFAAMSQSGQYNYDRCLKRGDRVAAYFALSVFMQNAISAIYLLRGRYMPFYKWSYFGLKQLNDTENYVNLLNSLARSKDGKAVIADTSGKTVISREYDVNVLIDAICGEISKECFERGLIDKEVSYLEDAVLPLSEQIRDDLIFKMPLETYVRLW